MADRPPVTIDMTPEGGFREAPAQGRPRGAPLSLKIGIGAALVATASVAVIAAALLLWLASVLIPVAIVAAFVAYVAFRVRGARRGRSVRRS